MNGACISQVRHEHGETHHGHGRVLRKREVPTKRNWASELCQWINTGARMYWTIEIVDAIVF